MGFFFVGQEGVEPSTAFADNILSVARIPIPPLAQHFTGCGEIGHKYFLVGIRKFCDPAYRQAGPPRRRFATCCDFQFSTQAKQLACSHAKKSSGFLEAWARIELAYGSFANFCLTTWLPRLVFNFITRSQYQLYIQVRAENFWHYSSHCVRATWLQRLIKLKVPKSIKSKANVCVNLTDFINF